jgi:hypothetical protein
MRLNSRSANRGTGVQFPTRSRLGLTQPAVQWITELFPRRSSGKDVTLATRAIWLGKVFPVLKCRRVGGGVEVYSCVRHRQQVEMSGQLDTSTAVLPSKQPHLHCIGCWVGPRPGPDAVENRNTSCLCRSRTLAVVLWPVAVHMKLRYPTFLHVAKVLCIL